MKKQGYFESEIGFIGSDFMEDVSLVGMFFVSIVLPLVLLTYSFIK